MSSVTPPKVLSYKSLSQKDLSPILNSRVRIWYPGRKGYEEPILGQDYIAPTKADILVMLLVELQNLGQRVELSEEVKNIFKNRTVTHLNGSCALNYVAKKGDFPIREQVNDNDVAVVITNPSEDKYPVFRLVDEVMRRVIGKLLNIKISYFPGLYVPPGADSWVPPEEVLSELGVRRSPFNALNLEHSIGGYSFEGADDFEQETSPLEISVHSISQPQVPLHFTNLDWFIPLNLYKIIEKRIPWYYQNFPKKEQPEPVDVEVLKLGSDSADSFCLRSKEVSEGEDITSVLEDVENRIITSKAALDPYSKSDPNQYLRLITDITDGFITLDPKILPFFLRKGGELSGDQLAKRITWWSHRKRSWIPNYNLFSLCTALMSCPKGNPLNEILATELSEQVQTIDVSTSGLEGSWISFFQELIKLLPVEGTSGFKQVCSLPILLRLFVPLCAYSTSLKKIGGKAQLQTKFQLNQRLLHIPIPVLSEKESEKFFINKQGGLLAPNVGDLRFLPLCRFLLMKEENLKNSWIRANETQIGSQVIQAIQEKNPEKAATRMLTCKLLLLEEVAALTPFCKGQYLSPEEIVALIPVVLDACINAPKKEVENALRFLTKELLPRVPLEFGKSLADATFLIPKILDASSRAPEKEAVEVLGFLRACLLPTIPLLQKKELSLKWIRGVFEAREDIIHEWPEVLWEGFIAWAREHDGSVDSKTSCISFLFGPQKLIDFVPKMLEVCINASEKGEEKALSFLNQNLLSAIPRRDQKKLCLGWMKVFFQAHQENIQKWPEPLWVQLRVMVSECAEAQKPWKAFCISLVRCLPLKITKKCAEFLLMLDKKTDAWPLSEFPVLIPDELSEILYNLKMAFFLRAVDLHRSFSYLRSALEKPAAEVVSAVGILGNKGLLDFESSLKTLLQEKQFDRAITLVACQRHLMGTFHVLSAYSEIYVKAEDKSKVKLILLKALHEVLQGGDSEEIAWRAYRYVYRVPEAAAYLEDTFFSDESKLLGLVKSKQDKVAYREAFNFRFDAVTKMKKSKMLTSFLVGLKASKEELSLAFEKVVQRCKKEEGKLEVFDWVRKNFPSRVDDLLELYKSCDRPFLYQCIWRLLESEDTIFKMRGWGLFVEHLEPLLKISQNKVVETTQRLFAELTERERASLVFACTKLPVSQREMAVPLFAKAINSEKSISLFLKDYEWSALNIYVGWDLIKMGEVSSSLIEQFVEGVVEKIPASSFFILTKEMTPYFNERSESAFLKRALALIREPVDGIKWQERMSFLLCPSIIKIVKENADLYLETLKLALKRPLHSAKWSRPSGSLVSKLLELSLDLQDMACSPQMEEEIQYARMSTILRYKEEGKSEFYVNWASIAEKLMDYLDQERFQDLTLEIISQNPSFAKIMLKQLVPYLNSTVDEEAVVPLVYRFISLLAEPVEKELALSLAKYTYEMYQRFPTDQFLKFTKESLLTSTKYELGNELKTEELFFLKQHADKLSQSLSQKNDEHVVAELFDIFAYKNCHHEAIREILEDALKYIVVRIGDEPFMQLLEEKAKSSLGLSFFLLRSLQNFLKIHPEEHHPAINKMMYSNISRIVSLSLDPDSHEMIRFFANRLFQLTEVPEHLRNQVMRSVVQRDTSEPMQMNIVSEERSQCSKDLIFLLMKVPTQENRDLVKNLMTTIHLSWVFNLNYSTLKAPPLVFLDIEALCIYLENEKSEELHELICRALMSCGDKVKSAFAVCEKIDAKRTQQLLIRFLNAVQNHCIGENEEVTVFYLGIAILDWILNPEKFSFLERINTKDILYPLFLSVYKAVWPYNGFSIFTSVYMEALEREMKEIIPVQELFSKSYEEILKIKKGSHGNQAISLRFFVKDVYNKCGAYYPDRKHGITKEFFMQVLDEAARITSLGDNLSIESLLESCPKKEEVLQDWQDWQSSKVSS